MAWLEYNPNPRLTKRGNPRRVGDCVIRAVAKALSMSWEDAYCLVCARGYKDGDMPSSDAVWGAVLKGMGFTMIALPDTCPECLTVSEFADTHSIGTYVLGTGSHAVTLVDGNYYDAWDSGDELPIFAWCKKTEGE